LIREKKGKAGGQIGILSNKKKGGRGEGLTLEKTLPVSIFSGGTIGVIVSETLAVVVAQGLPFGGAGRIVEIGGKVPTKKRSRSYHQFLVKRRGFAGAAGPLNTPSRGGQTWEKLV